MKTWKGSKVAWERHFASTGRWLDYTFRIRAKDSTWERGGRGTRMRVRRSQVATQGAEC